MSVSAYTFKHADGTILGTVNSMESNGPGAASVPLQIKDIDFSDAVTPKLIVPGGFSDRFPPATLNYVTVSSVDANARSITVTGNITNDPQLQFGLPIVLFDDLSKQFWEYTVMESTVSNGETTIYINAELPADINAWLASAHVSTIRSISVLGGAYESHYLIDEMGATISTDGNTILPIHVATPLSAPTYNIIGAESGANGSFTIRNAANAASQFRVGTTFGVTSNSLLTANSTYTVRSVDVSGSYTITNVQTNQVTIAGNHRKIFVNGLGLTINGHHFTIAASVSNGTTTTVSVVEPTTNVVAGNTLVCNPPVSVVVVNETVPAGVGTDGIMHPAAPSVFNFAVPPAITPVNQNEFMITWRISGDHAALFSVGTPILVKNNSFYSYSEFPVQSVTVSNGYTHIVTNVVSAGTTPYPDATGQLVYPSPAADYGFIQYTINDPISTVKLIGKGAPSYNHNTTWGQALQDNIITIAENFKTGVRATLTGIITGQHGQIKINKSYAGNVDLEVGSQITYSGDSSSNVSYVLTVQTATVVDNELVLTFVESLAPTLIGDGMLLAGGYSPSPALPGQLWYDASMPQLYHNTDTGWHGVLVQNVPAVEPVVMGGYQVTDMADPTSAADAVNLQTADRLFIAKSGGYSANGNSRSGSMTGSLNFGAKPATADWSTTGINLNDANIGLYGASSISFDSAGTGGVTINGSGNIIVNGSGNVDVLQGNVRVGDGTTNYVTVQNHVSACPTITFTSSTSGNDALNMGLNKIVNVSTPTMSTDAANKAYVDSLSNGIVWLQPVVDPNLFNDSLNAPPFISAAVVSATTGASNVWKLSGNIASSFVAGQLLTITDNTLAAANASYVIVSAVNNGANTDVTVSPNTIPAGAGNNGNAWDTSVPTHKTYIVGSAPTGAWTGLAGRAVVHTVTNIDPVTQTQTWGWLDILGRAVRAGDRFGVFVDPDAEDPLNVLPGGGVAGSAGKIATVATVSPLTYTFYTPTEPYAFSVTGVSPTLTSTAGSTKSPHFGHSYTFRGTWGTGTYGSTYKWIEFAGPSIFAAGSGLKYAGSVLNVGAGAGITVNSDTVQLDNTYISGIYLRLDGTYAMSGNLKMGGNTINNIATPTLSTDAANKAYVDSQTALRVSKAGDSMSGSLTFTSGTVTGITTPVLGVDAANKAYVDSQTALRVSKAGDTMTGSLVMSGAGVVITLPNAPTANTDATNKAYVDTKFPYTGGTLTGTLTLAGNPTNNLDATPKQYVDANFVKVATSTVFGSGVNLTLVGGELLGLPTTPSTSTAATSKAYVDNQITPLAVNSTVVHTAGSETITGAKTFSAATVLNNTLNVSANGVNNNVAVAASGISMTGTPVGSGGASAITITGGVNSGGVGGVVSAIGGNGSTLGGDVVLTGGQGSGGTGGNITITSGTGSTTSGQISLVAGSASLRLQPSGVWQVGGLTPTAKSQALCSDATNPTTASPTWQLVGTRVASAPASSASAGVIGNWFADDSYFYVYGATGWRRIATTTF